MSTFIIAEAGVNHNGSIEMAKELILAAKEIGADAIKFQSFKAENLVTKKAEKANYQKNTTGNGESQYEMLKKLELSYNDHLELIQTANAVGIEFISSPFDSEAALMLSGLGLRVLKIPSGELTNIPFLEEVAKLPMDVIISTGMANLAEIEMAVETLENGVIKSLTILHCVTEYPAPYNEINLKAMNTIKAAFNYPVGYSDHTPGIEIPLAAVAVGATVIEKHFTLDKNLPGPDHRASLDKEEFRSMITAIRNIELSLGDGVKRPAPCEIPNMKVARKSIVAARDIKAGEILSAANLTVKRPGTGIPPYRWNELVGKTATRNFVKDDLITL